MIIKGFRFGMLLQIAIGPVCLYIIRIAIESGFFVAEAGVIAATLMDALFVAFAIIGIGSLLDKPGVKKVLKYFGAIVVTYYGLGILLGSIDIDIIPTLQKVWETKDTSKVFITSFILTASSPLSILFWTGVFAAKISCDNFRKTDMIWFGVGAVSATLIFLSVVALFVGMINPVKTDSIANILNITVGIILIGFGIKMALSKLPSSMAPSV